MGDDDQAIYSFRGCSPEWIIELEKRSGRRVTSLELRTNYRNPPNLLAAAVRLIRRNRKRIPKRPIASRADDAAIEASDAGATIGGVVATNDSGPLRHKYGGVRDLVVGTGWAIT